MPSTKRAFLIASPFGELRGPENDVETMVKALQCRGFTDNRMCVASNATRDNILEQWKGLIKDTEEDDVVVFYYSGHGAFVKPDVKPDVKPEIPASDHRVQSKSLQFIVPIDYDKSNAKDFKGIFDVEISHFLWQITEDRECHDIQHPDDFDEIERKLHKLQDDFRRDSEGNPFSVRIVAGTQGETAWEHEDEEGRWQGALTRALGHSTRGSGRARHILALDYDPHAEGPSKRIHFTLEETDPGVFNFDVNDKIATIKGGRIAGLAKNDVFALVPYGREFKAPWVAKAKLWSVGVLDSKGDITQGESGETLPKKGNAILIERALRPSPLEIPPQMIELQKAVESLNFLQVKTKHETERMPSVRVENSVASLYDEGGNEVFRSRSDQTGKIVCAAEKLTRAKMFRNLRPKDEERLSHDLQLDFYVVVPDGRRANSSTGETHVSVDEKACISLHNYGERTLYVNIFDVNVAGQIVLLNADTPGGIEIKGHSPYVYG